MDILRGGRWFKTKRVKHDRVYDWGFLNVSESLSERGHVLPSLVNDGLRFQSASFVSEDMSETPIVFDTGASVSVSPKEDDFVSWESKVIKITT
jgi:hypothetical protein